MVLIEDNFQGVAIKGDYCYEKELQNGINNILVINMFTNMKNIQTIKYFKNMYDEEKLLDILYKITSKHLEPFKDKNKADLILKYKVIECFPKATQEVFNLIDKSKFAKDYIYDEVMKDLTSIYNQEKKYSNYVIEQLGSDI